MYIVLYADDRQWSSYIFQVPCHSSDAASVHLVFIRDKNSFSYACSSVPASSLTIRLVLRLRDNLWPVVLKLSCHFPSRSSCQHTLIILSLPDFVVPDFVVVPCCNFELSLISFLKSSVWADGCSVAHQLSSALVVRATLLRTRYLGSIAKSFRAYAENCLWVER